MCGFVGIFDIQSQAPRRREKILKMSSRIRHRGPDWSGVYSGGRCMLAHERLAIVDPLSGGQPLYSPDRKLVLAVNGEIYNHLAIRARIGNEYEFQTGSDCEVILALYKEKGIDFLENLNGIFAFALYDEEKDEYLAENIFYVSEKARWDYISKHANTQEIGQVIDQAMVEIEAENRRLRGILPKNFVRPELDKKRARGSGRYLY